jgi:hypothetical protein
MEPSRRAFLSGRRPPQTPWAVFCTRLLRAKLGRFHDDGEAGGVGCARLVPSGPFDVEIALSLCEDAGVSVALAGVRSRLAPASRSVVTIDPASLHGLTQVRDGAWHAQAGCRMRELVHAGLTQFTHADPDMTFAAWLADAGKLWRPGACADSGIVTLQALLADGTDATFGPFGENDTQPLRSAAVQRLVPALFQLSGSTEGLALRAQPHWPARYRLDALSPAAPHGVNLAHLFCGHAGTLGWVSSARLMPRAETPSTEHADIAIDTDQFDRNIKALFDPAERFPAFVRSSPTE